MYAVLSENIKRRMILELREFWARDPKYKDTLTPNIQGKYSFEERPQQAIILKSSSSSPIQFSADHYQGMVVSYVHLAKVAATNAAGATPFGSSIEWVKEDSRAIQSNSGVFPSAMGIYYIEVRRETMDWQGVPGEYLVFYVDPLLGVIDEQPTFIDPRTYDLNNGSFHPGSLVVYELPGNIPLYEGINYSADPLTGRITLVEPLPSRTALSVDYRYAGTSTGPFLVEENGSNHTAIPGVVLAFGRRAYEGDIMAVVVTDRREEQAREYGGRWEMSLDFDVMARDVHAQGEITDRTLSYMYAELRDRLSFEGIEISEVSSGGEAEEVYDENGDDYFYTASLSMSVMTDWAIHVPLGAAISRVLPGTLTQDKIASGMSPDQIGTTGTASGILATDNLGLVAVQDPWFRDRSKNYELIR